MIFSLESDVPPVGHHEEQESRGVGVWEYYSHCVGGQWWPSGWQDGGDVSGITGVGN